MCSQAIELLAPAGNAACLHAAVRAGADAVYLGAGDHNARRGADNFTLEDLRTACDYAHLRGVRIYLTVNTVVLPSEVNGALELVRQAWAAGVDAFIVQDIGLMAEIARTLPEAEIHVSTQMNTHNAAGVRAAAALGAARITFARELSLAEVERLSAEAHGLGVATEVFAHGALCVCYSGQCFASSLVGGRSANRGMCAQVCRLPYELHSASVKNPLDAPGDYLLSPKDLCTIDLLEPLVAAGVDSLKIEGRMKSPEYVHAVVQTYRAVLDRVLDARGAAAAQATDAERLALSDAFSRGFTQGYLAGHSGNGIMSYGRPNNRGVFAGRVAAVRDGRVEVACEVDLVEGDVVEFWTNKGRFAHAIVQLQHQGSTVAFDVSKPVGKGDRVFRVRSAAAAFVDDPCEPRIAVQGSISLHQGQPVRFSLAALDGCGSASVSVHVEGPVVEAARTKAIAGDEVRDHVDRFGGTPFALSQLDVGLGEGVGMGFSTLHHVRADAVSALEQALLAPWHNRRLPRVPKQERSSTSVRRMQASCQVAAWATNAACARAARKAGVDAIYVPALNYKRGQATVAGQRSATVEQAGYPKQVTIAIPTIDHDGGILGTGEPPSHMEETSFPSHRFPKGAAGSFDPWAYAKPGKPVFADSLGAVFRALDAGMQVEVGPHVPVTNALAARVLATAGVQRIWLSPELTLGQIQDIAEAADVALGLFVSGAAELMITEHCLLASQGPCNQDCETCARRTTPHYLKDRKGFEMPVITDCCGKSHLYNAVPLDVLHLAPDLLAAGISAFMVDTTLLNTAQTTAACVRAIRARDLAQRSGDAIGKQEGTTTGHMFRSVG